LTRNSVHGDTSKRAISSIDAFYQVHINLRATNSFSRAALRLVYNCI
jgi:hypothetical protein